MPKKEYSGATGSNCSQPYGKTAAVDPHAILLFHMLPAAAGRLFSPRQPQRRLTPQYTVRSQVPCRPVRSPLYCLRALTERHLAIPRFRPNPQLQPEGGTRRISAQE